MDQAFVSDIKSILAEARRSGYRAINLAMVDAYWRVGKRIVEEEQRGEVRANYGERVIKALSKALSAEFGKGFSIANLKNFRQFYLTFPEAEKSYAVCSQLSWSHYRLIMRVENPEARAYYIREAANQNWSTRTLERHINTFYYERLLSSPNKQEILQQSEVSEKTVSDDFIKDPYVFEFLNISEPYNIKETDIEASLIENLQDFLLELGKGFSFVGRQFRISTETSHFYIDLVFYNYILKCFVLFDLKTGKLTHQDIGQMDMYVRMFDDLKRIEGDNPTLGIILCTDKEETIVKYSILNDNEQLFASKYLAYLPTESELIIEIEREKRLLLKQKEDQSDIKVYKRRKLLKK
jgi:predicted nuclease of restriction endonuclease-like (RecB) superfamily